MAIILSFWWANSQRESIRTNLARIELSSLLSHLLAYNPSKNVGTSSQQAYTLLIDDSVCWNQPCTDSFDALTSSEHRRVVHLPVNACF